MSDFEIRIVDTTGIQILYAPSFEPYVHRHLVRARVDMSVVGACEWWRLWDAAIWNTPNHEQAIAVQCALTGLALAIARKYGLGAYS